MTGQGQDLLPVIISIKEEVQKEAGVILLQEEAVLRQEVVDILLQDQDQMTVILLAGVVLPQEAVEAIQVEDPEAVVVVQEAQVEAEGHQVVVVEDNINKKIK